MGSKGQKVGGRTRFQKIIYFSKAYAVQGYANCFFLQFFACLEVDLQGSFPHKDKGGGDLLSSR